MHTAAAAALAGVTVDTIRTWCRYGIITAIKQAGRWVINAASLQHRVRIDRDRRARACRPRFPSMTVVRSQCGHSRGVPWHALPGSAERPCTVCTHQQQVREELAEQRRIADTYGDGPRATEAQLRYLSGLAKQTQVVLDELPPTDHWPLLPRRVASHWIDMLKAQKNPRSSRCECASGRHGGACTC